MNRIFTLFFCLTFVLGTEAQKFPDEIQLSSDGRMLKTGHLPNTGLYDQSVINEIHLNFPQNDYWDDLEDNFDDGIDLAAQLIFNGEAFDSVGVRFKGSSSYNNIGTSPKKSFNISMDAFIEGQELLGYGTLNLNNCYHDPSFLREITYQNLIKDHVVTTKGNYVHLFINGQDWGLYANVQQVNKDLYKEWFYTNDGASWRCKRPPGSPASSGSDGDGTAALNNLGTDSTDYQPYYYLKFSDQPDHWTKLVQLCNVLDTVSPSRMANILSDYLDIDRALWFLASEIAYCDDDSYVLKGKTDYYIYFEPESGRIVPIEMDGNDAYDVDFTTSWGPFYHSTDVNYPLLERILSVPEFRQRYIAHLKTIISEDFNPATTFPKLDQYYDMIEDIVLNDPIKIYTDAEFEDEIDVIKDFITDRRTYLQGNSEMNEVGPVITNVIYKTDDTLWKTPVSMQDVNVNASVSRAGGVENVYLYYSDLLTGKFSRVTMHDDGLHEDELAGDHVYGAEIPGRIAGTRVRFYIEAIADNSDKTASYNPVGAEQDVYTYYVNPSRSADSSVVLNEIMAKNETIVTDSLGHYEDWIELYNRSNSPVDLSGYYLTDDTLNIRKWEMPAGTIIQPDSFLIIWTDEDGEEGLYHANFQMSGDGERITLLNSVLEIVDVVEFGIQQTDLSLSRLPNGMGDFVIQAPTFYANNNPVVVAGFEMTDSAGCASLTIAFTNMSVNASSYFWDFGDSINSALISPTHIFSQAGTYIVKLVATQGMFMDSIYRTVVVHPIPILDFGVDTIHSSAAAYQLNSPGIFQTYFWGAGNTDSSLLVDTENSYCLLVTDSNSCQMFDCVFVDLFFVGIDDVSSQSGISIYPDPANEYINISTSQNESGNLTIFNILGEIVYENYMEKRILIHTENWENGIYFFRAGSRTGKFMVNH